MKPLSASLYCVRKWGLLNDGTFCLLFLEKKVFFLTKEQRGQINSISSDKLFIGTWQSWHKSISVCIRESTFSVKSWHFKHKFRVVLTSQKSCVVWDSHRLQASDLKKPSLSQISQSPDLSGLLEEQIWHLPICFELPQPFRSELIFYKRHKKEKIRNHYCKCPICSIALTARRSLLNFHHNARFKGVK